MRSPRVFFTVSVLVLLASGATAQVPLNKDNMAAAMFTDFCVGLAGENERIADALNRIANESPHLAMRLQDADRLRFFGPNSVDAWLIQGVDGGQGALLQVQQSGACAIATVGLLEEQTAHLEASLNAATTGLDASLEMLGPTPALDGSDGTGTAYSVHIDGSTVNVAVWDKADEDSSGPAAITMFALRGESPTN